MCPEWRFVNLFIAWLAFLCPTIHFQLTKMSEGAAATLWNSCYCQKWTLLSCGNSCNCLSLAINRSIDCSQIGSQTPFRSPFEIFPFLFLLLFALICLLASGQFTFCAVIVHFYAVNSFLLSLLLAYFHGQCYWTLHLHYIFCVLPFS